MVGLKISVLNKEKIKNLDLEKLNVISDIIYQEYLETGSYYINLTLLSDEGIRKLNKNYRNKDKITDVLSFADIDINEKFPKLGGAKYLGDIFISYEQVKKQAQEYKVSNEKEFYLLLIHGILHLLGYDHIKDYEAQEMETQENKILKKIFK